MRSETRKRMSLWRRRALEQFPLLHIQISEAKNAYEVAFALRLALESAYEREPWDEAAIRSLYEYAWWCLDHAPVTEDAVLVSFYGNIVRNETVRRDMHRWLPPDQFHVVSGEFQYRLGKEAFAAFEREYKAA